MNAIALQQQAEIHLNQGNYEEAIALYEQCIQLNPENLSHYWQLGLAWLLLGNEAEAQSVWLSVIAEASPEQVEEGTIALLQALIQSGKQQLERQKFTSAERVYRQVLELDAEQPEVFYLLGKTLAQQGKLEDAIESWQIATSLNPELKEALQAQAEIFQKLGHWGAAIACYLQLVKQQPTNADIFYQLGICFYQQENWEDATVALQQAIELKPDFTEAWGNLGIVLLQQGDLDAAIDCLQRAIQQKPEFAETYCQWVNQSEKKSLIETNARLLNALQHDFDYSALGDVLTSTKEFELAAIAYQKAIESQSNLANTWTALGKALGAIGHIEAALVAYQTALETEPTSVETHLSFAKLLSTQADLEEALSHYQNAIALSPDHPEAYFEVGKVLSRQGRFQEALSYYQNAIELQPQDAQIYFHLGIVLARLGRSEDAIASFRQAIHLFQSLAPFVWNIVKQLEQENLFIRLEESILVGEPPSRWYETAKQWAISNQQYGLLIEIDPPSIVALKPPQTIDDDIHFSFRFPEAIELPETFVTTIPHGRFWLDQDQSCNAILAPSSANQDEYALLADLSPEFPILSPGHPDQLARKHWIFESQKLPPVQKIQGTVAVLSGLANDMYFHWMGDSLPRIDLLDRSGINLSEIDYFLASHHLPFQQETLQKLGIPAHKILETDRHFHLQADRLIVPSFSGGVAWMSQIACDFVRNTFLPQTTAPGYDYLYISRQKTANRRVINEEALVNFLSKFGFKTVTLESLSVAEQATLLSQAKVIISPHGGGLTNTLFCNPHATVIEIFSPNYIYPCYWYLSNLVGFQYCYLLGEMPYGNQVHKLLYPNPRIEDIFVNLDRLTQLLEKLEIT